MLNENHIFKYTNKSRISRYLPLLSTVQQGLVTGSIIYSVCALFMGTEVPTVNTKQGQAVDIISYYYHDRNNYNYNYGELRFIIL